MKVIFLDIDGVLNTSDTFKQVYNEYKLTGIRKVALDEDKIKILSYIVKETNSKIVLSSTWRFGFKKDKDILISIEERATELKKLFDKYDIEIYDITPRDSQSIRQNEIKEWLTYNTDIDSFVIIDDESADLTDFIDNELIQTKFSGLCSDHIETIINILNNYKKLIKNALNEGGCKMNNLENRLILKHILLSEDVVNSINSNLNTLVKIIPEIKDMFNFPHNHPHHHLDVWNHTLLALSMSNNNFDIRLALLLHDIGKPHSYQDGEIRHFKGHPKVSSEIAYQILTRLEYPNSFINKVCYLILYHDDPMTEEQIINIPAISFERYLIQRCDSLAHNPQKLEKRIAYLSSVEEIFSRIGYGNKIKVLR